MRKGLLRLTIVPVLLLMTAFGGFTTRTGYAQCGCSCSADCSGGCDILCEGCGILEWIDVAARCCRGARAGLDCPKGPGLEH